MTEREGEEPHPRRGIKKDFCFYRRVGAAYNRRLLEIVICAGNDYSRASGDRPKGAGDTRFRVGRIVAGRGREPPGGTSC